MKILFGIVLTAIIVIISVTSNVGVHARESTTQGPISLNDIATNADITQQGRFDVFADPCVIAFEFDSNLPNVKCSLSCVILGAENGGYCDANNVCQCDQVNVRTDSSVLL